MKLKNFLRDLWLWSLTLLVTVFFILPLAIFTAVMAKITGDPLD